MKVKQTNTENKIEKAEDSCCNLVSAEVACCEPVSANVEQNESPCCDTDQNNGQSGISCC